MRTLLEFLAAIPVGTLPQDSPALDPAALLPKETFVYLLLKHPARSAMSACEFGPGSERRNAADAFRDALEIAAGWELGIPPEEMERLRDRIWIHEAVRPTEEGSPFETRFALVIVGFPRERLQRLPADEPRTFSGEFAYAVHGDLVLAANDREGLNQMLRRARGEESAPSLPDDPGFRQARSEAGPGSEFLLLPGTAIHTFLRRAFRRAPIEGRRPPEETLRKVDRLIDLLVGALVTFVEERSGAMRTDIRLLFDGRHPLFPLYQAFRQEPAGPGPVDRIPAEAGLAAGFQLDLPALHRRLRGLRAPEEGSEGDPAVEMARAAVAGLASLRSGPEVEEGLDWIASTFAGQGVVFTRQALAALFVGNHDLRGWGLALSLRASARLDSIVERLGRWGIPVEGVDEGLAVARFRGWPPVFLSIDGDALLAGFAPDTIRRMREASPSRSSLATDPLFQELFPAGRLRSKWIFARIEAIQGLLRPFALGLASRSKPIEKLAVGLETNEAPEALHFWAGTSPVPILELMSPENMLPISPGGRTEGFRGSEEKALAALLALREAQEDFRARGIRDRDGDGLPEYGTLADLAAASLLPRGLTPGADTEEAEGAGYLFRADVPFETDVAERHWAGYAWPREYGTTGVNSFWIRPKGLPRRMANAEFAGPGRGPRPESALLTPRSSDVPLVEEYLWTPVGK
ncbi:MAG TPA: hypothetical protein VFI25_08485 [Planctomycetota bacterium]|nr:hypothetical protein [Planctomycetota bacterium]